MFLAYQSGHGAADWTDCQRLTHFSSQAPLMQGVERQHILLVLQVASFVGGGGVGHSTPPPWSVRAVNSIILAATKFFGFIAAHIFCDT